MINFTKVLFNKRNIIILITIISVIIYLFLFAKNNNKIINLSNLKFDKKIYLNLLTLNNDKHNKKEITDNQIQTEFIKEFSRHLQQTTETFYKNISLENINLLEEIDFKFNRDQNSIDLKAKSTSNHFENKKTFLFEIVDYRKDLSKLNLNYIFIENINQKKIDDEIKSRIILPQLQKDSYFQNLSLGDVFIDFASSKENKIIIKAKPTSYNFKNEKELLLKELLKLPIKINTINTKKLFSNLEDLSKDIFVVKERIIEQLKTEPQMLNITPEDIDIEMNLPEKKIIIKSKFTNLNFQNQKTFDWEILDNRKDLSNIIIDNIWLIPRNIINTSSSFIKKEILSKIKNYYIFSDLTLEDFDIELKTEENKIIIKAKPTSLNFKNEKIFNWQKIDNRKDLSEIINEKVLISGEKILEKNFNLIDEIILKIKQKNKIDNFNSKEINIEFPSSDKIIVKPNIKSLYFKNEKILDYKTETLKTNLKYIKLNNISINEQNLENIDVVKFEILQQIQQSDYFFSDLTLEDFDIKLKTKENKIIIKAKPKSFKFKNHKKLDLILKKEKKDLQQLNIEMNSLKISKQNLMNASAVKLEILPQIQKLDILFFNLTLNDFDIEILLEEYEIIIKAKPTSLNFQNEKKFNFIFNLNKKDLRSINIDKIYIPEDDLLFNYKIKLKVFDQIKVTEPLFFNFTLDDFDISLDKEKNKIFIQAKDTSTNFEHQKIFHLAKFSLKTDLADIKIDYIFMDEQDLSIYSNSFKKFINKIQNDSAKFINLNLNEIDVEIKKNENKIIIKAKPTSLNFKNKKEFSITYDKIYSIRKDLQKEDSLINQFDIITIEKRNYQNYEKNKEEVWKQLLQNDFFSDLTLEDFDIQLKTEENKIIIKAKPTSLNFKHETTLSLLIIDKRKNINDLPQILFNLSQKNKNNIEEIKKSLLLKIKELHSFFNDLTLEDFDIQLKIEENKIIIKAKPTSLNFQNAKILNFKMIDDRIDLINIKDFDIVIQEENLNNDDLFKQKVLEQIQSLEPQINSLWNSLTISDFKIIKNSEKKITVQAVEESNNYKNKKQFSLKLEKTKIDLTNLKNLQQISLDYRDIPTDNYHDPSVKKYIKEKTLLEIKKIINLNDVNEENLTFDINIGQQSINIIANENNKYLKNSHFLIFIIDDPRISLTALKLPKLAINLSDNNEVEIKNKIIKIFKERLNLENVSSTDFKIKIDSKNKIINIKAEEKNLIIKEEIDLNYSIIDNRKDLVNIDIFNIEIDEEILIKKDINIKKKIFSNIKKDLNFNDLTLEDFDIELTTEENKIIIKAKPTSLKFKNEKILNLIIQNIKIDLNNIANKNINISKKYLTNLPTILQESNNIKKEIISQIKTEFNFTDLTLDDFDIEISEEHLKNEIFREFCYMTAKPTSLKFKNEKKLNIIHI
ncbi:hypothetical protein ATP_00086 [Candidatus Phytoplasma mali]|uniref:Uncharacterized protein n=1 Tax=Phytoplasma mali (strain AT) TaxID=482235 RepID=B3R0A9_PHYMT|nr:hypothetical protein [Candidatus Phytoplasma mali]CAP18273.1 hypothetical protein ATP_00086 [Candidatus Phytoplasma mali]